jgi:single-strand DNA-binding protein
MASRSVNKVILIGRLGRDAETAFTAAQIAIVKFSVATSMRWKDKQTGDWKEETNWSNIVFWRGENVAPYLLKGTQVYVEGRLHTRSYDDKDGKKVWATEVVADEVILLGGKSDGAPSGGGGGDEYSQMQEPMKSGPRSRQAPAVPAQGAPMSGGVDEDDVPF